MSGVAAGAAGLLMLSAVGGATVGRPVRARAPASSSLRIAMHPYVSPLHLLL